MGSSKVGHKSIGMEPKAGSCGRPPETSPLSPLPSPSHRPGEGNAVGAVLLVDCCIRIGTDAKRHFTSTIASTESPLPDGGRAMGEGTGVRFRVFGTPFAFLSREGNDAWVEKRSTTWRLIPSGSSTWMS